MEKHERSMIGTTTKKEEAEAGLLTWTCLGCRKSKVRCDRRLPACGRCTRLNRPCTAQSRGPGRPLKRGNRKAKYTRRRKPEERDGQQQQEHQKQQVDEGDKQQQKRRKQPQQTQEGEESSFSSLLSISPTTSSSSSSSLATFLAYDKQQQQQTIEGEGSSSPSSLTSFLAYNKEQQQEQQQTKKRRQQQAATKVEASSVSSSSSSLIPFLACYRQQQQQPQQMIDSVLPPTIACSMISFLAYDKQQQPAGREEASLGSASSSSLLSGGTTTTTASSSLISFLAYDTQQQQGQRQHQEEEFYPSRPPTLETSSSSSLLSWETSTVIGGPTSYEWDDATEGLEDIAMMQSFFVEMMDGLGVEAKEEVAAAVEDNGGEGKGEVMQGGGGSSGGCPTVDVEALGVSYPDAYQVVKIFGQTAGDLYQQGQIQRHQTLAIIRTWDACSRLLGRDASCGLANALLRLLAAPLSHHIIHVLQQAVQEDVTLRSKRTEDLLADHSLMPRHVYNILVDTTATCGFVFARGQIRMWTNQRFAAQYFDSSRANQQLQQSGLLPIYIYASIMKAYDRLCFFKHLSTYLFSTRDEKVELAMVAETIKQDGSMQTCLIRLRHAVLNDADYACMAMSICPLAQSFASDRLFTAHYHQMAEETVDNRLNGSSVHPAAEMVDSRSLSSSAASFASTRLSTYHRVGGEAVDNHSLPLPPRLSPSFSSSSSLSSAPSSAPSSPLPAVPAYLPPAARGPFIRSTSSTTTTAAVTAYHPPAAQGSTIKLSFAAPAYHPPAAKGPTIDPSPSAAVHAYYPLAEERSIKPCKPLPPTTAVPTYHPPEEGPIFKPSLPPPTALLHPSIIMNELSPSPPYNHPSPLQHHMPSLPFPPTPPRMMVAAATGTAAISPSSAPASPSYSYSARGTSFASSSSYHQTATETSRRSPAFLSSRLTAMMMSVRGEADDRYYLS